MPDCNPPAQMSILVVTSDPGVVALVERIVGLAWPLTVAATFSAVLVGASPQYAAAILDARLQDGSTTELLRQLQSTHAILPTVVVTAGGDAAGVRDALGGGATCVVDVDRAATIVELAARLSATGAPRTALGGSGTGTARARPVDVFADANELSRRERQILELAVADQSRKEIAVELGVSINTVKTQVRSLLQKSDEVSLTRLAWRLRAP